jgi:hypothetical protein
MKKIALILVLALLLGGGTMAALSSPAQAQYAYPPPPADIYGSPWVGPNTPWTFFNGDWFLNGILYYFFGPQYGWAPYYAYPPIYIVRPETWYAPRWNVWYRSHPVYWQNFRREYPYWARHRVGERYDRDFYERHHHGQGAWQGGFHGRPPAAVHHEGRKPGPGRVAPEERRGPARVAPPEERRMAPARKAPPEERRAPARVAPPEGHRPPSAVTHPEGHRPPPAVAHPEGHRPPPAAREHPPAKKPEKAPPGEEKH